MLLQGVCDHNLQFIDCFAGYPGSVHDARLLRNSPLYQDVQQNILNLFPHDTHLIGDPAYPLDSWLLVAYRDNGHLTAVQKKFNLKLSMTRSVIERAFALLKGRFRRLKLF